MKFRKMILLILMYLSTVQLSYSREIDNFIKLDSIWHTYDENKNFSYYPNLLALNDFFIYNSLQNHMNSVFTKDIKIIRIINAQQYGIALYEECLDFYLNPDVCFLYNNPKGKEIHLVFWDKKSKNIVDKKFESSFNFELLSKSKSYKGFKIDWRLARRNHFSLQPFGTGISISVYSQNEIFVKSIKEFWKNYDDGLRVDFFDEVKGNPQTIKNLKRLLLDLRPHVRFEDYCRDCEPKHVADSIIEEYKKYRHLLLDVDEVDKRIRERRMEEKRAKSSIQQK